MDSFKVVTNKSEDLSSVWHYFKKHHGYSQKRDFTFRCRWKSWITFRARSSHTSCCDTYRLLVESERAFSSAGYFCSKLRSRFNDDSLDKLCFLKFYSPKNC